MVVVVVFVCSGRRREQEDEEETRRSWGGGEETGVTLVYNPPEGVEKKHLPKIKRKGEVGSLLNDATFGKATTNVFCSFLSVNCSTWEGLQDTTRMSMTVNVRCGRSCACTREVLGRCGVAAFVRV